MIGAACDNANADGDDVIPSIEAEGLLKAVQYPIGQANGIFFMGQIVEKDDELVPAEPRDGVFTMNA